MPALTRKQIKLAAGTGMVLLGSWIFLRSGSLPSTENRIPLPTHPGPPEDLPAPLRESVKPLGGKAATSPLEKEPAAETPLVLDLKSATKLGTVLFIKGDTVSDIDPEFAELFKLRPEQFAQAQAALKDATDELHRIEATTITNLQKNGAAVTFEIPYFPEAGAAIEEKLFRELKQALPSEVSGYLQENKDRFFRYPLAEFGKLARKFVITPLQDDRDGRKWLMTENFFARAADWAVKEGRPAELEYGSRLYRFDKIPARFEHLFEPH